MFMDMVNCIEEVMSPEGREWSPNNCEPDLNNLLIIRDLKTLLYKLCSPQIIFFSVFGELIVLK